MSRSRQGLVLAIIAFTIAGCIEDESVICGEAELTSALGAAFEGDTVTVGRCEVSGSFVVYPGVTLAGLDRDRSVLKTVGTDPVVRLEGGAVGPTVTDLTIISNGSVGLVARGDGSARIERVTIKAERGIGLGVEGLDVVTINDLLLDGPVEEDALQELPASPIPEEIATHGFVVARVEEANLEEVSSSGFARFGALLIQSDTTWHRGAVTKNAMTGLMVQRGAATLRDLVLCDTFRNKTMSYGGVFAEGAVVETHNVTVCNSELGLLQDGATTVHHDLNVSENIYAAVWVQQCPMVEITGDDTLIDQNAFAGVVLIETGDAVINGGQISNSVKALGVWGLDGTQEIGDGVHVVRPQGTVNLKNVSLIDNERIGLLLTLYGDEGDGLVLDNVSVEGRGEALGAIAQGTGVPDGWDRAVTRDAETAATDEAQVDPLPIARYQENAVPHVNEMLDYLDVL